MRKEQVRYDDGSYAREYVIVDEDDSINEAADFINDALAEFPKDKYAAVLQAAIARRD